MDRDIRLSAWSSFFTAVGLALAFRIHDPFVVALPYALAVGALSLILIVPFAVFAALGLEGLILWCRRRVQSLSQERPHPPR